MIILFTFSDEKEKEKFEYIYNRYKKLLLHHAYKILQNYTLAEDAVSDAFIRIYKNLEKIENPSSNQGIAFIVTITRNAALTLLRKEKKHASTEYDDLQEDSFQLENHVISKLSNEAVYNLLNQLTEEHRSVFLLKYGQDMTHKEIAKAVGISENNVTVRIHRARNQIAELLRKGGYQSEAE